MMIIYLRVWRSDRHSLWIHNIHSIYSNKKSNVKELSWKSKKEYRKSWTNKDFGIWEHIMMTSSRKVQDFNHEPLLYRIFSNFVIINKFKNNNK